MLCSVPHMITSLMKQRFSQSFSPHNNKSQRPYENATVTKDLGTKYLAAQRRFIQKKKKKERAMEKKNLAVFHLAKREGGLITLNKAFPTSKSNL